MKNGGADVVHIRVAVVHGVSHLFRKSTSGGGADLRFDGVFPSGISLK